MTDGDTTQDGPAAQSDRPAPSPGGPSAADRPEALDAVDADRIEDVDVRDQLRRGEEPFEEIMAAAAGLAPDGVLRVRAIFEPEPLYGVLGGRGFEHWTERLGDDDWRVWFWRPEEG